MVAQEFLSDQSPEKIVAYYKEQLTKFGPVLECRGHWQGMEPGIHVDESDGDHGDSGKEGCQTESNGRVELKVGASDYRHLVSVKPDGKGSDFALVVIRTHGKRGSI